MKATLYDALGILPTSSHEEIRAALRGLIRKYYTKTRDGQGNVEEALRFINHASRILSDAERRERYDHELKASTEDTDHQIARIVGNALSGDDENTDAGVDTEAQGDGTEDPLASGRPDDEPDVPALHHPGLTQRVASFGRSPFLTAGLCGLLAAFIAAAIVFVTPTDAVVVARQVLGWLTVAVIVLSGVYGAVHGLMYLRRHQAATRSALTPQTDLAILNWRRERSVFLGTNQPQEDASWIFQLRMAELERAKSGRTSEPRPWHRLAARMFDYSIWGLLLALLYTQARAFGIIPAQVGYWLSHPLVAPVLITLSWIPVETLLITAVGTTPGKWLFGIYLQFSVSDAYARRDTRAQLARGAMRALRVWYEGVGCGFPLVAPVLVAVAYEKLAQNQETDWDFAQDSLVTHGPAGVLNTVTGVCGLASMLWLYGVAWHQPMADSIAWTRTTIADALPSTSTVMSTLAGGFRQIDRYVPAFPPSRPPASSQPAATQPATAPTSRATVPQRPQLSPPPRATSPKAGAGTAATAPTASAMAANTDTIDPDIGAMIAARRARIEVLSIEGPQTLRAGNAKRAGELCRTWVDLDLDNPEAWRCLGQAQQAQGNYQDAINAFRKARQHDPGDRTLDAAILGAERGLVAQFLNRYSHH